MKRFIYTKTILVLAVLICGVAAATAQRPVRSAILKSKSLDSERSKESVEEIYRLPQQRFSDTLSVGAGGGEVETIDHTSDEYMFEEAMAAFDHNDTKSACEQFRQLSLSAKLTTALVFESLFMTAECAAVQGNYNEAERILVRLTTKPEIPLPTLEKSLIRLGHIFCALKKNDEAEVAFQRFNREFPNSKYAKLTNCDVVK